ncbi:hypothetical protein [Shewanella algae]|uniref:hypothetical protein n=1 Tax=Shewanella algae TaxID=38313 RepID=UPI0011846981|nr:hypothetical protein [Shewanella algae]TVO80805.1 hypothetical protein AYI76_18700 [Shewanella algae]TVO80904.1 hypothetical protein AYI78_18380 [Shewanella algae]TVO91699.1 hypothetical protein AYI79_18300 [Shewanella algae]
MEDLQLQINKLKYQMSLVGESLDSREHPIATLVIAMNWDDKDLDKAHDIFEKFEGIIESGEEPNWYEFERDFNQQFGIGYQTLKMVVLAFHRNFQWTHVCEVYAKAKECMEFHEITRPKNF